MEENDECESHLYVHLIPHSHDDIGWKKTIEGYYDELVRNIITTYMNELLKDPKKRFTQVEIKFFSMWWDEQNGHMQESVKDLVKQGRLEFVGGGWSMHDEACPHYDGMINNMLLGHEWLDRTFGDIARPRIGWQLDPFGHSNANPRLFAEMGFDSWFFARIDAQDKIKRLAEKSMQWVWKPFSKSLGDRVSIFTHTMPDHYNQPSTFLYDAVRQPTLEPIVIDKTKLSFNGDEKCAVLRDYILDNATHFRTNRLMIPWGDDFYYSNAKSGFALLEDTIEYCNA